MGTEGAECQREQPLGHSVGGWDAPHVCSVIKASSQRSAGTRGGPGLYHLWPFKLNK